MLNSLKEWLNVPYSFEPFIKRTGAGTKVYGEAVSSVCYPVGEIKTVTDIDGAEVISNTQLYVDGSEPIKVGDRVTVAGDVGTAVSISKFYRDGVVDIKVVYL